MLHMLRATAFSLGASAAAVTALGLTVGCHRADSITTERLEFPGAPVILVSIDTLRADRLPVYGYTAVATPALDALRRDSILFSHAYSHSPLTLPSHVSMLTGRLPAEHGVRNNVGFAFESAGVPTIQTLLRANGYATGAAVSAYVLRGATGLGATFDFFEDSIAVAADQAISAVQRPGAVTARIARAWIDERIHEPFFFLLHLFEPHSPYDPPEPYRTRYADRYDGEVAYADEIVGGFLDHLRLTGVYDRAIVIVTADHGEGLLDHGEDEHGIFLYREAIQVPLILKLPGQRRAGDTITAPAQLIDLLPTVAELTGCRLPVSMPGSSLLSGSQQAGDPRWIFSETLYPRIHLGWSELSSLVGGGYHYIHGPRPELYDVESDPGEKTNIINDHSAQAETMELIVRDMATPLEILPAIDPEELDRLRALGYLGSAVAGPADALPDPKERIGEISDLRAAARLASAGRTEDAIRGFRRVLAENPNLTDGWLQLAKIHEAEGRLPEAAAAYCTAIDLMPVISTETALSLAEVMYRMSRFDEAGRYARMALPLRLGAAHLLLGRIAMSEQSFSAAAEHARTAATDGAYRIPARVLLARAMAGGGSTHLKEALAILDAAAREAERLDHGAIPMLHFARGDILARLNRPAQAEAAFRAEIGHFPSNGQAFANLAVVLYLQRRPDEVYQVLEALMEANPDRESALLAARTIDQLGDADTAARWRRRAETLR